MSKSVLPQTNLVTRMLSLWTLLAARRASRPRIDESLTQKASLNALASTLDYGARLVVGFVINPLLVNGLGNYGFGVWQVLGRMIGYLAPASGRTTQALKWSIASQQESKDYEEKRRQVGSTIVVFLLFSPVFLLMGGLLVWFAPQWLDSPAEFSWTVRLATCVLVINLILISLVHVPRSVLTGENLGYKRMGLSALLVFIGGAFTALALYLDLGLVGVASATLAQTLLTGVLFWQVARTYVPWFGIGKPTVESVRRFFGLSGWFLAWNFIMRLMRASDVVVLGILDSAELVTSYSLTRYVPETVIVFVAIVVLAINPGLGGILGSGNFLKAARVRGEIMSFTWLAVTAAGATILLWDRTFVQLWVGSEHYAGATPTLLIIVMVMQFVLIRNDANIIDLTLNLRHKVVIGLISVALSLVLSAILVGLYDAGISGLCLGFVLGRSILSWGYPRLVGRFLGISSSFQLKGLIRPGLVTVLLFGVATSLLETVTATTASTWPGLVVGASVTLGASTVIAFYGGLSEEQRNRMLKRLRRLTASIPL